LEVLWPVHQLTQRIGRGILTSNSRLGRGILGQDEHHLGGSCRGLEVIRNGAQERVGREQAAPAEKAAQRWEHHVEGVHLGIASANGSDGRHLAKNLKSSKKYGFKKEY